MVRITNGIVTFEVTNGAYETIYSKQGFKKVDGEGKKPEAPVNNSSSDDVNTPANDAGNGNTNPDDNANDAASDDEKFCEELLETPIAQWKKDDVKKFAKIKEIDLAGTSNVNEAKERIKAFLDGADEE